MRSRITLGGIENILEMWRNYISSLASKPESLRLYDAINILQLPLTFYTINSLSEKLHLPILISQKRRRKDCVWIQLPDGHKMRSPWDESYSTSLMIKDIYGEKIYGDIPKGGRVIDVGAHFGIYSLYASNLAQIVYAFEPRMESFNYLQMNTASRKNIHVMRLAITDVPGSVILYDADLSTHCSLSTGQIGRKLTGERVKATSIDNLMSTEKMGKVDLLKIDAEGFELPVLRGCQNNLKNFRICRLAIGAYHYPGEGSILEEYLEKFGYRTIRNEKRETLIFAS